MDEEWDNVTPQDLRDAGYQGGDAITAGDDASDEDTINRRVWEQCAEDSKDWPDVRGWIA